MDIDKWLEKFINFWIGKDVQGILSLFTDDVIYFETPYLQLKSKEEILSEWEGIKSQDNVGLALTVFSKSENKSSILWDLTYKKNGEKHNFKGTYLIELTQEGKCKYFYQTCEERK